MMIKIFCFKLVKFFMESFAFLYVLILLTLIYICSMAYYWDNDSMIMDIFITYIYTGIFLIIFLYFCELITFYYFLEESCKREKKELEHQCELQRKKLEHQCELQRKELEHQCELQRKELEHQCLEDQKRSQLARDDFEFKLIQSKQPNTTQKKNFNINYTYFNKEKVQKTSESVTEEKLNTDTKNNIKK